MSRTVFKLGIVGLLYSGAAFGAANETGINVDYLYDSDNTPMLADVMRTYRTVNLSSSTYAANDAPLDANGWATSDAWYFLGDPAAIKHGDGTYAIKFNGIANISLGKGNANGKVTNQVYDPVTNTTTALLVTKTGVDLTDVRFSNTQRTSTSATNTGVTNIQIMRPTTPGGSTPYSFDTTFTQQTETIAKKVSVLRFMDYLATNNNTQVNWADRVSPTQVKLNPTMASSSRGKGGPLELAVQLGNESNRDIWINIPAMASDDYIQKVAQLIKYGSDGVNPYTSPQKNPVYKPLNPNLHVYVEYSNETWNTGFKQFSQISTMATAEVTAEKAAGGNGPLTFDGVTNSYYLAERYNALRTKQIADTFSGVFGSSAMLNTVRPVLEWQYGNGSDTANQAVTVLDGYYNNTRGNFVSNPTPLNSYIYGGGSAMYYSPSTPTANLTVDAIVTEPAVQTAARTAKIVKDVAFSTAFGIKRIAYEGGLSLDPGTAGETTDSLAAKMAALADARMTQLVVTNHNTWTNQGGDLLVYYFSTDQYKFAMSDENFSTDTPKLQALDILANTPATSNYSVGTPVPKSAATTIAGGNWTINGKSTTASGSGSTTLKAGDWTAYLINLPETGDFKLTANIKTTTATAAHFQLLLGGGIMGDFASFLSAAGANSSAILLTLPKGITSLRVLALPGSGDFTLNGITFTPVGSTPVPEPVGAATLAMGGAALLKRRRK